MENARIDEFVEALENGEFKLFINGEAETEETEETEVNTVICDICGETVPEEDTINVNGTIVCKDCEEDNVVTCDCCGCVSLYDDCTQVNYDIICPDCLDTYYDTCADCGEYVNRDYLYRTASGDYICESCRDNYFYCDRCDELYHRDFVEWDENEEQYLCEDCRQELRNRAINNYNYKPIPIFYGRQTPTEKKDRTRYYGFELEIDKGGEYSHNAQKLKDIANNASEHIYIKHDGSISNGFEIVSHPCTFEYHKNNIPWDELMEEAISLGYRSHDTDTCGLHIHVSRNGLGETYGQREDTISRIIYFIENHWQKVLVFTRRNERNLERWASRYGIDIDVEETYKKVKNRNSYDRYKCINLTNEHTIEFRLFRGTLKYSTFIATLEFVHILCEMCKTVDMQTIEKMSWNDFVCNIDKVEYPELTEYLKERNLDI